jgi:hypothetical protein
MRLGVAEAIFASCYDFAERFRGRAWSDGYRGNRINDKVSRPSHRESSALLSSVCSTKRIGAIHSRHSVKQNSANRPDHGLAGERKEAARD